MSFGKPKTVAKKPIDYTPMAIVVRNKLREFLSPLDGKLVVLFIQSAGKEEPAPAAALPIPKRFGDPTPPGHSQSC